MKSEDLQHLVTMKGLAVFIVVFWAVALLDFAQEDNTPATNADTEKVQSCEPDDNDIYCCGFDLLTHDAEFPGGDEAMLKWIKSHLQYPEDCEKKGIEGRVIVSFCSLL